jgi:colanic acid biosynthesis glycosyl transferase WcaI
MKIIVHDFAGHPFQFQLSRELARRGHKVMHAYFADLSGPKGGFCIEPGEAARLLIEPIRINANFERYSFVERLRAHHRYVSILKSKVREFQPEVVLSGNMPTEAQYRLSRECIRHGVRFVHWIQDFYALALETLLTKKMGVWGQLGASPFHLLERRIFKTSDAVVYISDDFSRYAAETSYAPKKSFVIENWASLDELPTRRKDNEWSRRHSLTGKFVFLYSGTMGLKHNPQTLVELARKFSDRSDVRIVLVSEGIGRKFLDECRQREGLNNLLLLDFQPYAQLPDVLGTADVLLANVEPQSSMFSVPSKILSYLCAGRAILMAVPYQNLAARVVDRAGAGYVCEPADTAEFLRRAESLWSSSFLCAQMGLNARRYAESTFDISKIGDCFEDVLRNPEVNEFAVNGKIAVRASQ